MNGIFSYTLPSKVGESPPFLFTLIPERVVDIAQKITATVEPSLDAMGYAVVLIRLADGMRRKTLTVMAERKDGQNMGFDDCSEISRTVGALLEVEDPIVGAYDLEVCSPGLDRPLTRLGDFEKYKGAEAKIETMIPEAGGRKRFRGIKDEMVQMQTPEEAVEIAFGNIRSARLIPALEIGSAKKEKPGRKKNQYA